MQYCEMENHNINILSFFFYYLKFEKIKSLLRVINKINNCIINNILY